MTLDRRASAEVAIRAGRDGNDLSAVNDYYASCGATGRASARDDLLLAEANGEVVGVVRICRENGTLVLRGMRVRDDQQHRGIGRELLDMAVARIGDAESHCLPFASLERFYGRVGFERIDPLEMPPHLQARYAEYRRRGLDLICMRRANDRLRHDHSAHMKVRRSARIIVLNRTGAVLFVRYDDSTPIDPGKPGLLTYWVPPGGGVESGESFEQAAIRELEEETGIELSEVGSQIWSRERQLMHRGELKRYVERYFLASAESPRLLRNRTREKIGEIRWWTLDELRGSSETFLPEGFAELVAPLLRGEVPSAPVDIT